MFKYVVLLSAIVIATVAAFFSVSGLGKLFAGSFLAVVVMASVLEAGKLVTASLLTRHWQDLTRLMRAYYLLATFVLIVVTSAGIYGFLTAAYQTTADQLSILDRQTQVLDLRKERYQEQLDLYIGERETLSLTVGELSRGLANNVIQYVDAETGQLITTTSINTRVALQEQLQIATQERGNLALRIEELTDSVTQLDLQALNLIVDSEVVAEVGPLRYLSNLTGWPMDSVVNIYALLLIFVFDPLAVSLIVAYNRLHLLEAPSKKVKIKEKDEKKFNEPLDKPGQDVLDLDEEIKEVDDLPEHLKRGVGPMRHYQSE
jgi:hypothetical protein